MHNYSKFLKDQQAVALKYDESSDPAPKIVAIGKGIYAEQIIKIAKDNNIPLHKDADLVHILQFLELDSYIPIEVYITVSEIIAHIHEKNKIFKNKNQG